MTLTTIVEPDMPITLEQAKLHCRVDHDDDDSAIEGFIAAATRHVEASYSLSIMPRTYRLEFGGTYAALSKGPVVSIETVGYDGGTVTDYEYDNGVLTVAWPDGVDGGYVEYVAGDNDAPEAIHAILLTVGQFYENREGMDGAHDFAVRSLMHPHWSPL